MGGSFCAVDPPQTCKWSEWEHRRVRSLFPAIGSSSRSRNLPYFLRVFLRAFRSRAKFHRTGKAESTAVSFGIKHLTPGPRNAFPPGEREGQLFVVLLQLYLRHAAHVNNIIAAGNCLMCLSVELRVCYVIVFNTHDNPCGVVITHSVCDKSQ